jgi:hypothetical protein
MKTVAANAMSAASVDLAGCAVVVTAATVGSALDAADEVAAAVVVGRRAGCAVLVGIARVGLGAKVEVIRD